MSEYNRLLGLSFNCETWWSSIVDVDVLKVQLAASEGDIFFLTNQLSAQSAIMKKKKIHYIYRPGVNTDAFSFHIRYIETS